LVRSFRHPPSAPERDSCDAGKKHYPCGYGAPS
jgi:hypothetical protein